MCKHISPEKSTAQCAKVINLLVFTVFTQEKRFNDNADFDIGSLGS